MILSETEKKLKELEQFQFAYEANFRILIGQKLVDAITKNKTDYINCRKELIKQGIDVAISPRELNYLEIQN